MSFVIVNSLQTNTTSWLWVGKGLVYVLVKDSNGLDELLLVRVFSVALEHVPFQTVGVLSFKNY